MTLKNKLFIILTILFSNLIFVNSFNVCNVDIQEPWLITSDDTGVEVLIVDNQGDMYFEGIGHSYDDKNAIQSFTIGNNIHFNRDTSKFSNYNDNLTTIPNTTQGLEIQNSIGETISLFAEDGSIYTKGQGIYNGSQAGCLNDGWLYCNDDGVTRENRDYFCRVTGNKTGFCTHTILDSEDCSTKLNNDTDGGINRWTAGTVYDYIDCSGGSCTFNSYSDVCTSSTVLREYYNSGSYSSSSSSSYSHYSISISCVNGDCVSSEYSNSSSSYSNSSSSYSYTSIDCSNDDYYFCSNLDRMEKRYHCSSGACEFNYDQFVETCIAPSTSYGTWSCNTATEKVRTNTIYSPTCTSGSCDVDSSNVNEYENCIGATHCSSGNCVADTYSWVPSSWSTCSEPCDGGTQTRSITCRRDYDNKLMSDSYCSGTKPSTSRTCNTQSCCKPSGTFLRYQCTSNPSFFCGFEQTIDEHNSFYAFANVDGCCSNSIIHNCEHGEFNAQGPWYENCPSHTTLSVFEDKYGVKPTTLTIRCK